MHFAQVGWRSLHLPAKMTVMSEALRIKPHHLVDILTQHGSGRDRWEPSPYGHAEHLVAQQVLNDPDIVVEMDSGADAICAPCIHNVDGLCDDTIDTSFRPAAPRSKREWNLLIDRRWYARLELADGDRLTARDFAARVKGVVEGGLTDIYREVPETMVAERVRKLTAGLASYLGK